MLTSSIFKRSVLFFVILCLFGGMSARISGQPPQQPKFVFPKEDPIISEKFRQHLAKLEPQEKVKVWVFFTDKGFQDLDAFHSAVTQMEKALTSRAAKRRTKTMKQNLVDFYDLPVNQAYIDRIMNFQTKLRQRSRWLNAASFEVSVSELEKISELSFVRSIKPVLGGKRKPIRIEAPPEEPLQGKGLFDLNYGASYSQLQQLNIPAVHNLGYYGQGVLVCMMDTGYRKDHQAFQLAYSEGRVLAEWDFINDDGNTQNETGDPSGQHNHGTYTWSTLGGAADGNLYGPAYGAYFILAKTEDISMEEPIEEDNWVAGMEWADSIGADLISSSLAYIDWYTYPDLDGNTAVTTIAADIAAQRGIVVCNAMGNSGPGSGTLMAPADADSILACGAVYSSGTIASFSSRGPTYDGRIKPEVCARGVSTSCADPYGTTGYTTASGTSLSTPLIGGAAAVILSAHLDWTPMQVREAMMESGDHSSSPDNTYGWGVPDILAAIQYSFYLTGDVNGDEEINLADVVYLINYLYKEGPPPSPLFLGDVNCDDEVDIGDVVYLINYLYQNGPEPCSH
ncbi:MAG: S8 family serine peptidase [candidate division Zixibacteria bacterium]|nr:S8 family serine peptidase [candidate division Zixibacteria bacterium]